MSAAAPGGGPARARVLADGLRAIAADNPSPFTLDGTRTFLVGRGRVAVIDPGPALAEHVAAVAAAVGETEAVILLTHEHPDHAGAAEDLGRALAAPVLGLGRDTLRDGQIVATDAGELVAMATPGHTPDHLALHWPVGSAAFVGDLMLGGQDTALVAAPEGDLGDYLDSLARVRELRCSTLYPAHGPPFTDPASAVDRYFRHRQLRQRQVLDALRAGASTEEALAAAVYGADLHPSLGRVARGAVIAYLEHLEDLGRVRRRGAGGWEPVAGD